MFLCVLIGLAIAERAGRQGWMTYIPNTVLIRALPYADDGSGPLFQEIETRIFANGLSDEQVLAIYRRAAKGDAGAPPPSDAWTEKYGEFIRGSARAVAARVDPENQADIYELLHAIPPRFELETRRAWPSGSEPIIHVNAYDWWPTVPELRVTVAPNLDGAETQVFERWQGPIQFRSFGIQLPTLPPGEHTVTIDFTIERRFTTSAPWELLDERRIELELLVSDSAAPRPEPVSSPSMDRSIARVVSGGLIKWSSGSLPVRIRVDHRPTRTSEFEDTAVALRLVVRRNGEFGRRLDIWWLGGSMVDDRQYAWEVPLHDDDVLIAPDQPDDVWTIHATGDPNIALLVDGARHYWDGEVEVEVSVRPAGGAAPPRGWIRPPGSWNPAEESSAIDATADRPEADAAVPADDSL
jgi:hypothetical protein